MHGCFQFFLPNKKKIFGSDFFEMNTFELMNPRTFFQEFEVSVKSKWKTLDQPSQRCLDSDHVDTMGCIEDYIKRTVGCYGSECYSDTEKLAKFVNISKRLQNFDGEDIFKLTGCLAACQRNEFQIKQKGTLKEDRLEGSDWMMNLGFYFPRGEWEEKDQVS